MLTQEQKDQLNKPLCASHVKTRSQSGIKLSYIESHHAIREANRIFGFDGWNSGVTQLTVVQQEQKPNPDNPGPGKWYVAYVCKVLLTNETTSREGVGYGSGIDYDLGRAHESAVKEAESDAMKRAFRTWGDQFGLALYDKTQANVEAPEPQQKQTPARQVAQEPKQEPKVDPRAKKCADTLKSFGYDARMIADFMSECKALGLDWTDVVSKAYGFSCDDKTAFTKNCNSIINDARKARN